MSEWFTNLQEGEQVAFMFLGGALSIATLVICLLKAAKIYEFFRSIIVGTLCATFGHKFTAREALNFQSITPTEEEALFRAYCSRLGCKTQGKTHSEMRPRRAIDVLDTERRQWEFVSKVVGSIDDKQKDWEWKGDVDYDHGKLSNEKLGIIISADRTCGGKEVGGFSKPLGMPSLRDYMRVILTTACESWLIWDRKRRHMKALDEAISVFEPKKLGRKKN